MAQLKGNYLPSLDQLMALTKGRVPKNTPANTEKWDKIMNQWRNDVHYNYSLESQDKDIIELEVTQFLCGVTPKRSGYYSRASLKNALSAISRHLQNVKPGWRYNLHNKIDFPDLHARFDSLLKDMKKKGIGEMKSTDGLSTDEIRSIINYEALNPNTPLGLLKRVFFWICILGAPRENYQGGIDGSQFDLNIPFPPDPPGIASPNYDIRKFLSLQPQKGKCPYLYLSISKSANAIAQGKWYNDKQLADRTIHSMFKNICIECEIDIKGRNISNHSGRKTSIIELFDLGVAENTGMAITGHCSFEEINISDSSFISSFSTISEIESDDSNSENNNITQGNFSSDHNNFCTAKEIMQKNTKHPLQEYNSILSDDNKRRKKNYGHKKITVVKKYYKNCTFSK
ncbi:unnamed protein product [Rhizophagus irregularis]|nr:unnamed protein product [Rhizophagus irregularis]